MINNPVMVITHNDSRLLMGALSPRGADACVGVLLGGPAAARPPTNARRHLSVNSIRCPRQGPSPPPAALRELLGS